ncbi:MAG TPA: hypothetical protein VMJ33_00290 [Gallionella sp.]|nr:hypothetical protein [Gallionella sp.]
MKKGKVAIFATANTVLLSLLSFSALADTTTPASLEERVQLNAGKQLGAEGYKYAQIVTLAADREHELTTKRYAAANAYKKWHELKSAVVKHYPTTQDYLAVEQASNEYARANKAFIEMQKSILAQHGAPIQNVATNLIALE